MDDKKAWQQCKYTNWEKGRENYEVDGMNAKPWTGNVTRLDIAAATVKR